MNGLDKSILSDYVERIFLFARNKTYSSEEAEDLSQEILLQACRSIDSLRNVASLEPWLWGLANNVLKVFRRKQGKQKAFFLYDTEMTDDLPGPCIYEDDSHYDQLRRKLLMLSAQYREILIYHYFDGMSCAQIAEHLGIPEGTVKWRLSEGRSRLKKEWDNLTESALKPKLLSITISGNGNYDGIQRLFPYSFISDALSQNVLWHAYEKPKTVEDLSEATSVPTHYIEDCLVNLTKREAVVKTPGNKYQTAFIIYTRSVVNYINSNGSKIASGIFNAFLDDLDACTDEIMDTGFYTAGRSINELKHLFAVLAVKNNSDMFNPAAEIPCKVKYDGFCWAYHATDKDAGSPVNTVNIGERRSANLGSDGSFSYRVFSYNGSANRKMLLYDQEINTCERLFYRLPLSDTDKERAAKLIKDGYLRRVNSGIEVNIPAFRLEEMNKFNEIVKTAFADTGKLYKKLTSEYIDGYTNMFPSHLHEDAARSASWLCNRLLAFILEKGVETGRLDRIPDDCTCDVLVQWRDSIIK